ncbi:hypothetical protein PSEUDO9AG_50291 [Pseudomonas sp. 9Ag]|nr:hypothetical protein PSEUDO9AG_50291 [Pseudomonas sp. 9Ag]
MRAGFKNLQEASATVERHGTYAEAASEGKVCSYHPPDPGSAHISGKYYVYKGQHGIGGRI